jgi:hypothetical protein
MGDVLGEAAKQHHYKCFIKVLQLTNAQIEAIPASLLNAFSAGSL